MNDMYEKGYQDGYANGHKDGYQKGWHAAGVQRDTFTVDDNKCPKCQMKLTSPMGYVCSSPNCPTFLRTTC